MTPTEKDRERARVYVHHHQDAPCVAECGDEIAQMLSDAREEGRREEWERLSFTSDKQTVAWKARALKAEAALGEAAASYEKQHNDGQP